MIAGVVAQVVSIGGAWGTAVRAIDGVIQLVVGFYVLRMARDTYPVLRVWWAATGGAWFALGVGLIASPLGLMPPTWTPWVTHGMLMVFGPLYATLAVKALAAHRAAETELAEAMDRQEDDE